MATVEYLHVCDSAFMAEGGKHCIIGIFDVIYSTAFPANHASMTVAMKIQGTAHEPLSLRVELARPNGEVLAAIPVNVSLDLKGGAVVNLTMVATQFPEAGRYIVKVLASGQTLVSHSLHLQQAQTRPQGGTQAPPQKLH
jgi:hypothetical protein